MGRETDGGRCSKMIESYSEGENQSLLSSRLGRGTPVCSSLRLREQLPADKRPPFSATLLLGYGIKTPCQSHTDTHTRTPYTNQQITSDRGFPAGI